MRRGWLLIPLLLFLAGCSTSEIAETESVQHARERNAPVPSSEEMERTLNGWKAAVWQSRDFAACEYLTPHSLRELVAAYAKDPGKMTEAAFKRDCPLYLRVFSKQKADFRTAHIEVRKIDKEELNGRYYLVVYPQKGPSIVMNNAGRRIVVFAGPEEGE